MEPFLEASVESDHNDSRNEIRYSFMRLLNLDFKRAVFKQIAIVWNSYFLVYILSMQMCTLFEEFPKGQE